MKRNPSLKLQIKESLIFLLVAVLLIGTGAFIYYLYGYKDSFWIEAISYLPIIFGWLCMLYPLITIHVRIKGKEKGGPSVIRKAGHALFFIAYPAWLVVLVAGFLELSLLTERRVEKILASDEVGFSKARVIRVEERRRKSSSHIYAIIEYNAGGESVQQAIKDGGFYRQGQEIDIKYAAKYPDMFTVVGGY
jgi:hypothetical protein